MLLSLEVTAFKHLVIKGNKCSGPEELHPSVRKEVTMERINMLIAIYQDVEVLEKSLGFGKIQMQCLYSRQKSGNYRRVGLTIDIITEKTAGDLVNQKTMSTVDWFYRKKIVFELKMFVFCDVTDQLD